MDKQEFEAKFDKIYNLFGDLLDKYEEANPESVKTTFLQLIYDSILSLKAYVENPEEKDITWDNPFVELQYPIEIHWEELRPLLFKITDRDLQDTEKLTELLSKGFLQVKEMFVFRALTKDVAILREEGKEEVLLPTDIIEKLKKLSEKKRQKALEEIQKTFFGYEYKGMTVKDATFALPIKGQVQDAKGRERKFETALLVDFNPLVIEKDAKRAYYPVIVGLEFYRGYKPTQWSEEDRQEFWDVILKTIEEQTPEEKIPKRPFVTPIESPTFAIPSHPLMFTLLAMFSGKPERIPRKLLEKPYNERTPEEQKEADEFLNSILETEIKTTYNSKGQEEREEKRLALISDNPKVEAKAEISGTLFSNDLSFREEALAIYIKRTFGAEGLRHLLGLIIGLEENFRQGHFEWTVNEHLERLGYKRKQGGAFDSELKKTATEIVKIFTSLFITARQKDGKGRERIQGERLFSIDGFKIDMFNKEIIDETIKLRATDFWYKNAFEPKDGRAPMFTKLLKKIAQENHRNHPLTIYLAPLFAIFWRMNPEQKLSVKSLMDWCNLDINDHNRMYHLRDLESELNYMKEKGYLGEWTNSGESPLPSECKDPFDCVLILTPPDWLKEELKQIEGKKEQFLSPKTERNKPSLTREEFIRLLNNSGLAINQFANNLGISRQMVSYIKSGKRKISPQLDEKIREVFGYMLPV